MKRLPIVFKALFNRQWWWVTLSVILLMIGLARLGIWQLDRLEQRRAENARFEETLASEPLELTPSFSPDNPDALLHRQATAVGTFDFNAQITLKVQKWRGRSGVHLITPFVFADGETAVLVDRGWIPDQENVPETLHQFDEPRAKVEGFIALSQVLGRETAVVISEPQASWYRVDIEAIQPQMPYTLLPVYLLQLPNDNQEFPLRAEPEIDLSEGSHLSYALQWFIFSSGLGMAYIIFINKNTP